MTAYMNQRPSGQDQESPRMTDLATIRRKAILGLLVAFALHIPLFLAVALARGLPFFLPVLGTVVVVAVIAGTWWRDRDGPGTRCVFHASRPGCSDDADHPFHIMPTGLFIASRPAGGGRLPAP
jgi:hypothetical protein